MADIILSDSAPVVLPAPRVDIRVRPGTDADIDFIDSLQKQNSKQLGFMNRPTLEGKVKLGHVLVAVAATPASPIRAPDDNTERGDAGVAATSPVGYLIGNDRYKHRDELGVIFQMCVAKNYRRSLVAANLLKTQFEQSAYGCKLYCCWCAQDIEANRFWESMGFVPLAFRAGSEKKSRIHIFWQKRIRAGDTQTPWWFPSETSGGLMDAARIALPIPPGMTWQDELPRLLPTAGVPTVPAERALPAMNEPGESKLRERKTSAPPRPSGGLFFGKPKPAEGEIEKPAKPKRVKKNDPALAAKARELRDRYLEQYNSAPPALSNGKYDVSRMIGDQTRIEVIDAANIGAMRTQSVNTHSVNTRSVNTCGAKLLEAA